MCHGKAMAHVLLLHSALGLRPAVISVADDLRAAGHTVITPDYYEGRVFDTESEGLAYRDATGVPALMRRAATSLDNLPDDAVLAGFSLGAFFAQAFTAKRPQARATVLFHSVAAPRGPWNGVPVQLHRYTVDPFVDEPDVAALRDAVTTSGALLDDVVVPGEGHLFTDLDTPDGDAAPRNDAVNRMLRFIA